jgi:hypothetical protein
MASRSADAGAESGLAGAPLPAHHRGFHRNPGTSPSWHRARGARPAHPGEPRSPKAPPGHALASLPYLIVLAGVAVGLFVTWQGSRYARLGTGLVGGALLAAAAARLALPPRYTELLSSRWKASDVLAFAVLGAGVLALALVLP